MERQRRLPAQSLGVCRCFQSPPLLCHLKKKDKKKEKKGGDRRSKSTDERKNISRVQRLCNFSATARKNSRLRQRVLSSHLSFPTSSSLARDCTEHPRLQATGDVASPNIPLPIIPRPDGDGTNQFSFISPVSAVLGSCDGFIILRNVATSTRGRRGRWPIPTCRGVMGSSRGQSRAEHTVVPDGNIPARMGRRAQLRGLQQIPCNELLLLQSFLNIFS